MRSVDYSPKIFRGLRFPEYLICALCVSGASIAWFTLAGNALDARPFPGQDHIRDLRRDLPNIAPGPDMPAAVPLEIVRERSGHAVNDARAGEGDAALSLPGRGMPASESDGGFGWTRAERGEALVTMAESYLGLPYLYGGSKPQTGFDCSGFTGYLYAKFGIALPRSAHAQSISKALKSTREPAPGDLVFFKINRKRVSHVGMYVGGDVFIHSPRTGKSIEFGNLKLKYWKTRFAGARRPI